MPTNPYDNIEKAMGPGGYPAGAPSAEELVQMEEMGPMPNMDGSVVTELDDGGVEIGFPEEELGQELPFAGNLATVLESQALGALSSELLAEYEENKLSREEWADTYKRGLDLLGYKKEERTEPFPGASALTHPLLAEAATQFQAQAFKELLPAKGPIKGSIVGKRTEDLLQQSVRVANFMNYYVTEVMDEYTPEFDQLLFELALCGSAFKKVFYDEGLGRVTSLYVPAENLVVPYHTSSLGTCPRLGQLVPMQTNEIKRLQLKGFYRDDVDVEASMVPVTDSVTDKKDELGGESPTTANNDDVNLIEFHVELDLEGFEHKNDTGEPTGLKLPYIVTVVEDSGEVLSVYRNHHEGDPEFRKKDYFVHYKFLPGLGFYGFGLTHAIGNMAEAAGSILRSLVDAGTFANLPAGYKANGIRIDQSTEPLLPGEFRDIDIPGGRIQDALMPLPFKGPNQTLFALLGFVVEAGQRFAAITDLKVGDGNQEAPVGTTLALLEQGGQVMSAVHKRVYAAMKKEFRLMSVALATQPGLEYPYAVDEGVTLKEDFSGAVDVIPIADPNIFSQTQRITLAQTQLALAKEAPQIHNLYESYHRMHRALGTEDIDGILKPPPPPNPEPRDPAQEHMDVLDGLPLMAHDGQNSQAHIESHLMFSASPVASSNPAVMVALQKHVTHHVQIAAEEAATAEFIAENGNQPPDEDQKLQLEILIAEKVAIGLKQVRAKAIQISQEPQQGQSDPVIALKAQELQQEAKEHEDDQSLEQQKLQQRDSQFDDRLAATKQQTDDRLAMQEKLAKMKLSPQYNRG